MSAAGRNDAAVLGIEVTSRPDGPAGSPVGLELSSLVSVALRHNPRRAHLLVSTVLGKHVGVDPRVVHGCGVLLGNLVRLRLEGGSVPDRWRSAAAATVSGADPGALLQVLPRPEVPVGAPTVNSWRGAGGPVVLGFAETATALGHSVADALGARVYLHSTRRASDRVPTLGTFEEGHSHATTHLLLPAPAELLAGDDPLVLVDDEQSTGRTAMATIDALRTVFPTRRRFLVASLVDLRSDSDIAAMHEWAAGNGISVELVSLARGTVRLPPNVLAAAATHIAAHSAGHNTTDTAADAAAMGPIAAASPAAAPTPDIAAPNVMNGCWTPGLRQGGRFGFAHGSGPAFDHAIERLTEQVRAAIPAAAHRILVLGTEELMYLPLRLGLHLTDAFDVRFQSTTRSPVHAERTAGYPIRRRIDFAAEDGTVRHLYNATFPARTPDGGAEGGAADADADPDVIVLVVDDQPGTVVQAVAALGIPLIVVRLPEELPEQAALRGVRGTAADIATIPPTDTDAAVAAGFGSYRPEEVGWLLTDLSHAELEGEIGDRERRIQGGGEHYAESLPVEYQPGPEYRALFDRVLAESAPRLATAVGLVTDLVLAERPNPPVLVSLARAGTPIGILMRRWAAWKHDLALPHYTVSIVRDRGIDPVALQYIAARHDARDVVFVDGWTGKGAITVELADALQALKESGGPEFDPTLAVLSDPGSCTPLYGTRDDFLIASACLNSTVSGLVSRTVLNPELTSPQQFHGAKFYSELATDSTVDVSNRFVDTVSDRFAEVAAQVAAELPALRLSDRTPSFAGWKAVEQVRLAYGLPSINLVKPGVGETTRVLLRRVPWKILVRDPEAPDHLHIRLLAAERGVEVEQVPDLPYACLGLIKPIGDDL